MPAARVPLDFLDLLGGVGVAVCVAAVVGVSEEPGPSHRERPPHRSGLIAGVVRWIQLFFGDLKCLGQKRGA